MNQQLKLLKVFLTRLKTLINIHQEKQKQKQKQTLMKQAYNSMSLEWIQMENQNWDFRNDLDELPQLSGDETELQKIVQLVQGHMVIIRIM